nr:hypothetical protein [Sphingobium yanoikuyae]
MEDADEFLGIAPYGARTPLSSARRGNAVTVQPDGDIVWRSARCELPTDTTDDLCFFGIDLEDAIDGSACVVLSRDLSIAVCLSTSESASEHSCLETAEGLRSEVRKEHRTDEARDGQLDLVDLTL